jgi:hypothetical protein
VLVIAPTEETRTLTSDTVDANTLVVAPVAGAPMVTDATMFVALVVADVFGAFTLNDVNALNDSVNAVAAITTSPDVAVIESVLVDAVVIGELTLNDVCIAVVLVPAVAAVTKIFNAGTVAAFNDVIALVVITMIAVDDLVDNILVVAVVFAAKTLNAGTVPASILVDAAVFGAFVCTAKIPRST